MQRERDYIAYAGAAPLYQIAEVTISLLLAGCTVEDGKNAAIVLSRLLKVPVRFVHNGTLYGVTVEAVPLATLQNPADDSSENRA
jgi:hypothetical protein